MAYGGGIGTHLGLTDTFSAVTVEISRCSILLVPIGSLLTDGYIHKFHSQPISNNMLCSFLRANGNIRMDTGNFADYLFGSGTERVTFLYIVKNGDSTDALDTWDDPSNGGLSVSFAVA